MAENKDMAAELRIYGGKPIMTYVGFLNVLAKVTPPSAAPAFSGIQVNAEC